ncbi:MAG TPA: RDD family protein [Acidimicrobiales bacterium]|nr:RDD family protein [Acidimicrobiales bacterium]
MTESLSGTKISPWLRFGARFIDGLVLLIPLLIVTVPISGGFQVGSGNNGGKQFVATLLGTLVAYAYFVVMESNQGSTVGKRAVGLSVHSPAGKPTLKQAARRNAWMLLAIIPGGLGGFVEFVFAIAIGVSIGNSPTGQGFHDRFAGLQVERG